MGKNVFNMEIDDADKADIENSVKGFFDRHIVSMRTDEDALGRKRVTVYYEENKVRVFTWLGDKLANGYARIGVC